MVWTCDMSMRSAVVYEISNNPKLCAVLRFSGKENESKINNSQNILNVP